jgi:hypothetical protein
LTSLEILHFQPAWYREYSVGAAPAGSSDATSTIDSYTAQTAGDEEMADSCVDSSANGRSLSVDSPPTGLAGGSDRHEISDARKLGKALRLIEKLKEKCGYEKEVNQELAQRNEILKREVKEEGEKLKAVITAFDDLHKICAFLLDENGMSFSTVMRESVHVDFTVCCLYIFLRAIAYARITNGAYLW